MGRVDGRWVGAEVGGEKKRWEGELWLDYKVKLNKNKKLKNNFSFQEPPWALSFWWGNWIMMSDSIPFGFCLIGR